MANAIFSGTAPLVQTSLILSGRGGGQKGGNRMSVTLRPAMYLVVISVVALLALNVITPKLEARRRRMEAANETAVNTQQTIAGEKSRPVSYAHCFCRDDEEELLPAASQSTAARSEKWAMNT